MHVFQELSGGQCAGKWCPTRGRGAGPLLPWQESGHIRSHVEHAGREGRRKPRLRSISQSKIHFKSDLCRVVTEFLSYSGASSQLRRAPPANRLWICTRLLYYWCPGGLPRQVIYVLFVVILCEKSYRPSCSLLYYCVFVLMCAGGSGRHAFKRLWDLTTSCCMQQHMVFCTSPYSSEEISSGSVQVSSSRRK